MFDARASGFTRENFCNGPMEYGEIKRSRGLRLVIPSAADTLATLNFNLGENACAGKQW
jgi:hypothetical protein